MRAISTAYRQCAGRWGAAGSGVGGWQGPGVPPQQVRPRPLWLARPALQPAATVQPGHGPAPSPLPEAACSTPAHRKAEVAVGGVDIRDVSSQTMASKQPGLYFIGEVLDVTSRLGGYNFQWAWASGFACAQALVPESSPV